MEDPPSPWKKTDRARDRELKREAVITAGAAAFNERGYHNTSLDDIAARLNVSKPTVYYYVKNKEDILFEIFKVGLDRLEEGAHEAQTLEASADRKLAMLIRGYVALMTTGFGRCIIRVSDNELSPAIREEIRKIKRVTQGRIEAILAEGAQDGSLAVTDIKLSAFAIAGALNWVAMWYDPAKPRTPEEITTIFSELFGKALSRKEIPGHGRHPS